MNPTGRLRILIIEDDPIVSASLTRKLADHADLRIVDCLDSLSAASRYPMKHIDLALVDLSLADGFAYELISNIVQSTSTRVLVLSGLDDAQSILRALASGAAGYILKSSPGFELSEAIWGTMRSEAPLSPSIANHLLVNFRNSHSRWNIGAGRRRLTKREHDVLRAVSQGRTRKEIAKDLGISPYTVAEYLGNVYKKYEVTNKSAAVAAAIRDKEIDP